MFHVAICLVACFIFERAMPRSRTLSSFIHFQTGLFWFLANVVVLPFVVAKLSWYVGLLFSFKGLADQSKILQFCVGFVALDFFKFVIHYGFHRIPLLWNFHKVHHSIEQLTALSSFRVSWVEGIINILASVMMCSLLGLHFEIVFILNMISIAACLVQHTNVKLPYTRFFEMYFITPDNHKYHHSKRTINSYGQNFGFVLNIWDRIFKTYVYPHNAESEEIGLQGEKVPNGFFQQFLYPFVK